MSSRLIFDLYINEILNDIKGIVVSELVHRRLPDFLFVDNAVNIEGCGLKWIDNKD